MKGAVEKVAKARLEALVREAGDLIMGFYGSAAVETKTKADDSPVTAADMASHRHLVAALSTATPGIVVISEESVESDAETLRMIRARGAYWLVDPLDGTRDFIARTGDFTVNVAYIEGGVVQCGCVYAPARNDLYIAARGLGAEHVGAGGRRVGLRTRRCTMSAPHVLVSRHHRADESDELRLRFPHGEISEMGSSLKYCVIADAWADAAFRRSPTMIWDTAAAQIVLEEAGGAMVDADGKSLSYDGRALENPPFVAVGDLGASRAWVSTLSGRSTM